MDEVKGLGGIAYSLDEMGIVPKVATVPTPVP